MLLWKCMADKKKIFIDTNILLDVLCQRPLFKDDAFRLIDLAIDEQLELLIADLSIANIRYITRKELALADFYRVMEQFRPFLTVVPVGPKVVDDALALKAKDFEDALQYFAALQAGAECIVTRNVKDYLFAEIEVMTPHEFLTQL